MKPCPYIPSLLLPLCLAAAAAIGIRCSTATPTNPTKPVPPILLSLLDSGTVTIQYTGKNINAIVSFQDSVVCDMENVITMHSLKAHFYLTPELIAHKKVKKMVLPLYWLEKTSLPIDSTLKTPYDTLYFKVGLQQSNTARVYIVNLPPVIDSITAGKSVYYIALGTNKVHAFNYPLRDTSSKDIYLRLFAHDADTKTLKYSWCNSGDATRLIWNNTVNPHIAVYRPAKSDFVDVVTMITYDSYALEEATVTIARIAAGASRIDSLRFADTTVAGSGSPASVSVTRIDSSRTILYTRSSAVRAYWRAKNGIILSTPADTLCFAVTYVCTLGTKLDLLTKDTIVFMDSVRVVLRSVFGDSAVQSVKLYKKPLNKRPALDSVKFDTETAVFSNGMQPLFVHRVNPGTVTPMLAFAHDTDGSLGKLSFLWKGNAVAPWQLPNAALHTAASGRIFFDTVTCTVKDSMNFADSKRFVITDNFVPLIDSIRAKDTVFVSKGEADSTYYSCRRSRDTLAVSLYCHEPNAALHDTFSISVTYRDRYLKKTTVKTASFTYYSADSVYTDTVTATATDRYSGTGRKKIVLTFSRTGP